MAVSAKPKVVKPAKKVAKPVKKVVKPVKKVVKPKVAKPKVVKPKVVKKPRRNNIRGGVGSPVSGAEPRSLILSPKHSQPETPKELEDRLKEEAKAVKAAILASEYWVNREKEIIAEVKLKMEKEAAARAEARLAVEKELQKERRRAREDKEAREERERENAAADAARRITRYNNSILQGDRMTATDTDISREHYSWLTGEKGDWKPDRRY